MPGAGPGLLRHQLVSRCTFPPPGSPLDCGVSGGADSLALLALATAAGCQVTAWHVDHGLRKGSAEEADVVAAAARRYGAEFRAVAVTVEPGPNLEDRARRARLGALPAGACTGHTADDQAETVLLALLRGAGLDGLTGMPPARHPLLGLRRSDTAALCADEGLEPVADPTNDDLAWRRNRIRHQLLPLAADIAGRDVVPLLVRAAGLLRADAVVLGDAAGAIDPCDARALARAPVALARRAVRSWLTAAGGDSDARDVAHSGHSAARDVADSGDPAARDVPDSGGSGDSGTLATAAYPPSSAAVERVLAVARGEAVACEVAGVGRIARHRQRLVIERPGR